MLEIQWISGWASSRHSHKYRRAATLSWVFQAALGGVMCPKVSRLVMVMSYLP